MAGHAIRLRTDLKRALLPVALVAIPLALSGCSNLKETLGLNRKPPDEFTVVSRAPLSLPPDAMLRPPRPGEQRPQEAAAPQKGKQAVFGLDQQQVALGPAGASSGELALLRRAGAEDAKGDIRKKVDEETSSLLRTEEGFVEKILFWKDPKEPRAVVVNAPAEAERLRNNSAMGAPATQGQTPTVDTGKTRRGLLDGLF
ncbi:MAG: DUF3035 domain-containing protein [Alphaproteobacteria bacterium]|nr:DUF3035 domain-containing protein [Alphaproteobacteria bacterium]